jgi:hypothetical protein
MQFLFVILVLRESALHAHKSIMLRTEALDLSFWVCVTEDEETRLFIEHLQYLISELLGELHLFFALIACELR